MGVDRYQVEGLLQVGDENGPLPGELGYGEKVPNATIQISRPDLQPLLPEELQNPSEGQQKGFGGTSRQSASMGTCWTAWRFRNKMAYDLIKGIPHDGGAANPVCALYT